MGFLRPLACCMCCVDAGILLAHLHRFHAISMTLTDCQTTMHTSLVVLETLEAGCLLSMVFANDVVSILQHGFAVHCTMAIALFIENWNSLNSGSLLIIALLNAGYQLLVFGQISSLMLLTILAGWVPGRLVLGNAAEEAFLPLTRRTCQRSFGYFLCTVVCTMYYSRKKKLRNESQERDELEITKVHVSPVDEFRISSNEEDLATFIFIRWIHNTLPSFPGYAAWCIVSFLGYLPQKYKLPSAHTRAILASEEQLGLLMNTW